LARRPAPGFAAVVFIRVDSRSFAVELDPDGDAKRGGRFQTASR
jgi:hypothetical protein